MKAIYYIHQESIKTKVYGVMEENKLIIHPPIYLVGKNIDCWKCNSKMPVVALLAPKIKDIENEVCILSDIDEIPNELKNYLQNRVPTFRFRFSKMAGQKYFANTCPNCGIISGDFFLHSEPEAPFFPIDEDAAKTLYITEIPINHFVEIRASYSIGSGEIILKYAKRI